MKIKKIDLKGWRSFSEENGIILSNLKHINLLIGPNNSGKSNLFRYFYYLRELALKVLKDKKQSYNVLADYDLYNKINEVFSQQDTWAWENGKIVCNIELEDVESLWDENKPTFHEDKSNLKLYSMHDTKNKITCLSVKYDKENYLLMPMEDKPQVFNPKRGFYENPTDSLDYILDTYQYWTAFIKSLVFVDPIRHFDRGESPQKECDFDGSSIIKDIINLRNEKDSEWLIYKEELQKWLRNILSEPYFEIDPTATDIRFYIQRGDKKISSYLNQLGTGVSQLFMLLSYLYMNREIPLNVFIEEPECNLHPEAVIQFVDIIENNFKNHRFFISTHSSALIDRISNTWSIHKIVRKENNASIIQQCNNIIKKYELLDELGIRASQLLQSNFIIWVEGPSDRIYLNKWISDLSDRTLIEGKHYSFLMYGGSNLASYSIMDDERFINILSTSRYCAIVCDSDKCEESKTLKKRVQSIIERLETLNIEKIGDEQKFKDYIYLWITEGREIENYIPQDLLIKVLSMDKIRKHSFKEEEGNTKLVIELENLNKKKISKFDSFDCFYSQMYLLEDGSELSSKEKEKISKHYTDRKVQIAKEVISNWEDKNYNESLNLKSEIENLVERIKCSNSLLIK
ncbi:ATP-binding protein [Clostridium sp. C2-6-12]|uniref:ATP-dependent nuclease n=1 Tax=Clostridium sp. C2-6-12 TaxID=2698832 RepID=UPI001369A397|nr:ATP-binding protein [Clostridium sp. C2-6-12]